MIDQVTNPISDLHAGTHFCLFYDRDPSEQFPVLVPYICEGLSNNQQCIYVADDQTVDELTRRLLENGIDSATEISRGALKLWTRHEWRQPGEISSAEKLLQVREFVRQAYAAGFAGARFAVEMTWALEPDISPERMEHWEATLNTLFTPAFPCQIVCQYNRHRVDPQIVLAALYTHPLLIVGDEVYPNLFYQAPLIFETENAYGAAAKIDWMFSQLKRARTAEKERQMLIRERAARLGAINDFQNIPEIKDAEESRRRLVAIVESSDDAIISKDLNGTITSWNRGAEKLFGYSPEEMIGQPVLRLIPPERYNEEPGILERIRRDEPIEHYETVRRRKDGSLVEISLSVSPIKDSGGKIIGASKIARDITDRKEAERALRAAKNELARANEELERRVQERTAALERAQAERLRNMEEQKKLEDQLRQAQKMESIGTLAGGIAHDFNNILNIIKGYASILPRKDTNSADALKVIEDTIERGAALVKQLLTLARKSDTCLASIDPNQVLRDLSALLQQTLPKAVDVALQLECNLPPIMADAGQITQALLNLCVNARDAMPAGGKLTLKTAAVSPAQIQQKFPQAEDVDYVRIDVTDTGTGIEPAARARIFEPFFTTKPHGQGTGLGLAIVYGIAKNHNGFIDLATEVGAGATFSLYLPVMERDVKAAYADSAAGESPITDSANNRGVILIAEDEHNMRSLLRRSLSRIGYRVITAADGQEVIDLYHRHKEQIQVALLDLGLPKIQGWDIIVQLKRDNPDLHIVVTSGYVDPDLKIRLDGAGVDAVVYKPYAIGQVVGILQDIIQQSRKSLKPNTDAIFMA